MPQSTLLHALSDAAILTNPDGVVLGWNAAATRLFGWTDAEMIGRPLVERFPPGARSAVGERARQLATADDWDGEFEDFHKDGSRIWIEYHVRAVRDAVGTVTGVLGVSRPLSRVRAEELAREQRSRYASDILNSMSAHVAVLGPDGRIREVNRAWTRFAEENTPGGCAPPSTDIGINYVEVCRSCSGARSDEAEPAANGIEDVLRGKRSSFVIEYPCDSQSEQRWFAMNVTPLTGAGGGAVVAHYDITARKQAELAVRNQSRRTELALAAAHMGVWTLDLATERVDWSPEVYEILGVTEFDGTIESWSRFLHQDDSTGIRAHFSEAIERQSPFAGEFRIVRPSGEVRWLATMAQVECDPSGKPAWVIGTVHDITPRKRSEWALTTYNHILERIAAGSNLHEILNQVVGLVEDQLPGSLCSVLIVDKSAGCLRFGAGRSLPDEYNRAVDGVPIAPKAGSCGTAAFRGATVTVTDIATDPLWDDYRAIALAHGLRSCVSVPIISSGNVPGFDKGEVIGTFALYNRSPGDFDRLTYAVLTGAEELVRRAVPNGSGSESDLARVIEATHLAGVAIERDHAEAAIRESEERFRSVFDSAPSPIYVKDLDGRHLFVNKATAAMFGVPPAQWVGKRSRDLLPAHIATRCEAYDRAVLASQSPLHERHTAVLPDGREVTLLATHLVLRNNVGPYAICGILRDITEMVAAQREFERVWMHAPGPLCVSGYDGYFKRVNPAWTQLLGWSEEELLARPWADFVHPDDRTRTEQITRDMIEGQPVHRFVNRYRRKDGTYRWLSWDAISLLDERTMYGFARDITDEKQLEEQFRQAQKMEAIGQLASGVAHDFNNLLTVINGYTELFIEEMAANDPNREDMTQVLHAGRRAAELTSQLLAFSRTAIVEPKVLDVNHVVDSSARMLRRLIGEDVRLETNLANLPPVKIDPGQLEQVFMNLAVNARDAMPRGGRLTITTDVVDASDVVTTEPTEKHDGPYVRVSVTDTGTGIPLEVQGHIFEPFFTTKGPGKGTGLGLATVYGIVRQAGGTIVLQSEEGVGTTFRILLPAVPSLPISPKSAVINVAPRGSETVLIAEDEDGVRNLASTLLKLQGYKVLLAATGDEAVRVAAAHPGPIDLLLTDVVMPDLGGRALADAVRGLQPQLRVMFMSGYTDDAVLRTGVEAARDWFIQKPFTPLSLARRVREVLDASRGEREA
ncbi:MAG: PAS domain S-box protein [Myxococcales bacterium]|nr:PAS domain S-box protein [Myxococcales bacterium]